MLSNDPNFATPILPHEDCDCGDLCAWEPEFEWVENPVKRKFMLNLFHKIHGKVYPELEETARKHNLKTYQGLKAAWQEVKHAVVDRDDGWRDAWSSRFASVKGDPNLPLNRQHWTIAYRSYRIYSAVRVADYKYETYDQFARENDLTFARDKIGFNRSTSWFEKNILYNQLGVTHSGIKSYNSGFNGEPIYYKVYRNNTQWSMEALSLMARSAWHDVHGEHPDNWDDYETPPGMEDEEE